MWSPNFIHGGIKCVAESGGMPSERCWRYGALAVGASELILALVEFCLPNTLSQA